MTDAKTAYARCGSFCVYHAWDEGQGDHVLLLIERGILNTNTREAFGTPAGYINIETGYEQPAEGAIRELQEEILNPEGQPVMATITPDRLNVVATGFDYNAAEPGTPCIGVNWQGHECTLTPAEFGVISGHIEKLNTDPVYAQACRDRCRNETYNVVLMTAREVFNRAEQGTLDFRYPHEYAVVLKVARSLSL